MAADDKKTRVLQSHAPAVTRSAEARADVDDKIVFQCPNGHRIVVKAALAGKRGKCSKCRIDVTIPARSGEAADGGFVLPAFGEAGGEPSAQAEPIDFPTLQLGELPPARSGAAAGDATVASSAAPAEEETWNFIDVHGDSSAGSGGGAPWPGPAGGAVEVDNPTAFLVARLWAEREHGGVIELHLEGGSVILPEWYDARWSRGSLGLFASQAADGTVTLTAVAWETVRKIVVRQLTVVPDDMFA
ncbi:MAG: hypothetical protein FJ284_07620 [Planctomycetes bacterium]|nr:hypothetical protein [Planctomycetota bacterium]